MNNLKKIHEHLINVTIVNKKLTCLFLISLIIFSCEDVIQVDLETAQTRLVIDASLNWQKGTSGNEQFIKLSLTAPYFNNTIPPATGATVIVTDSNSNTFNFTEEGNTGIYTNNTFIPVINREYTLTITYNNEVYTATETLIPVSPIEFVEQENDGGFAGDEIEIKAFYTDPKDIENFYLFEFRKLATNIISLEVYDDEFTDGNQIFAFYSDENISSGDLLEIKNYGISRRAYSYLDILLQQTDDESGDPFETQPATVRGNCINTTNPDNYPLGYFRISETDTFTYVIE
ncbi:DUF4249 domain-containing protein [Sabulilitoribacter arenilitoris]|uniref:DUF4249 domain-containing protein n=1 Tax=Wocania arenilitoris TaxID=2044858 RepID=A0AAE3ER69_9FLAO|nr:DUF4249 domain-containing protein [Wocania arenilitoris]MCF7569382.1 DUF4249 domain-containing protein [Wocania arenilitoris]